MMNCKKYFGVLAFALVALTFTSCNDEVSYSDRLNIERHSVNSYLANNRVVNEIPADSVFETGVHAPFYRIDPDGNVYMQVLNAGDRMNDKAKPDDTMYFRYTRYNLNEWYTYGYLTVYESNETDMSVSPTSFKFQNFSLATSAQWGYGLQLPLTLLGAECEVNLIIKSAYGITGEIASVAPFLYHVRYYHSMI